ncbi:dna repair and recombination rad54 and rad54 [Trichoderma arundinaceum]|uniref:Dna repair and recombination rad54 and rad54 n=1 Tax=Trichoderma arundinaceum TaxID=490622 RepID=A0A395NHC4_TRIAR|nr:dna repair and recombination rad54 and rad54 [Trichoderma arundinaceum]
MDTNIQRALNDKLYDKRKVGALELEKIIRDLVASGSFQRVEEILGELCNDYAYAVHQPHARNGGLIGLAAAAIALGTLGADSELSVKNGAELLDRLIKDIVSESAASYISVLETSSSIDENSVAGEHQQHLPTAFSLQRFIPLLKERIHVINPFTRQFLVGWITLLDSIPDLELVTYLPEFLGGILKFLSDQNVDVRVATQTCLDKFLNEIKRISQVKRGLFENRRFKEGGKRKRQESLDSTGGRPNLEEGDELDSEALNDDDEDSMEEDWIPGQDVCSISPGQYAYRFVRHTDCDEEEDCLLESLRWIVEFLEICPEEVLPFTPKILAHMLPAMASTKETIRLAATRVNTCLMDYVVSLSDESDVNATQAATSANARLPLSQDKQDNSSLGRASLSNSRDNEIRSLTPGSGRMSSAAITTPDTTQIQANLDYTAAVNSLTLLFLNDHEATRVAALTWLIMLHRKAPRKVLAFNDGTFPALLKTLSDPSDAVVTRDLQLLSQISRNSEDDYFASFMINLLQLFSTDRKLLETRGNLIIRQLCISLSPERIYRTLADCIEKEEDVEFASIMVQNLNNNLITAPQLAEVRKRLRNLETKDGQTLFVALFRSWCYNAVATFSLCLLSQAYEQAYHLLQIFGELDMTVNMLIQVDKLVQLIESPVFTYLRLQLLEPEKYPYLYKCMYGILMLLPQSSAFAALKNRLNSVSSIGYLQIAPRSDFGVDGH